MGNFASQALQKVRGEKFRYFSLVQQRQDKRFLNQAFLILWILSAIPTWLGKSFYLIPLSNQYAMYSKSSQDIRVQRYRRIHSEISRHRWYSISTVTPKQLHKVCSYHDRTSIVLVTANRSPSHSR